MIVKVCLNLLRNVFPIRVENEDAVEHNKYQQSYRITVPQTLDSPFEFECQKICSWKSDKKEAYYC